MPYDLSENQIKEKSKKAINQYKFEVSTCLNLVYQLFNQQTYDKALSYVELLKQESENFPNLLEKYLNEKFFPEHKKFLHFLKNEHKGKLDCTNNQTENYIGNTMPRAHKKKFRILK